ncbi:MAG TPA: sulfite exporter TauE/SafE family protein [Terracidiphilus sp.]|nr:sulfite exporter TauE/SafE family protein [Terracidiphilus sp.]
MELILGFLIAALIAMTGVGAGTVTAPLLILFLHVPVPEAVGTALVYSAAVKLVVVPVQIWRRQVVWRTLGIMLLAGVPGVVLGAIFFEKLVRIQGQTLWLYLALGAMIAVSSAWHIYRHFRPASARRNAADHPWLLAASMFPVGAEVGFSSSGAGALGTLALLGLTALDVPRIVGTDLSFGLCLSLIGGGMHLSQGGVNPVLLTNLIIGGVLGALVGTGLAPRIPARAMRLALSLWLFGMGVQLCWHALSQARI